MWLRQQLDHAQNKANREEKTIMNTHDQFQDLIKILDAESEKHVLMLKLLTNQWHHFKEGIDQYEM